MFTAKSSHFKSPALIKNKRIRHVITPCVGALLTFNICFVFVENYRLGLRELFNICHIKKSARSWKIGTGDRGEVSLQSIRVRCRDGRENLAKQVHIAVRGRQNERESILFSTVKTS